MFKQTVEFNNQEYTFNVFSIDSFREECSIAFNVGMPDGNQMKLYADLSNERYTFWIEKMENGNMKLLNVIEVVNNFNLARFIEITCAQKVVHLWKDSLYIKEVTSLNDANGLTDNQLILLHNHLGKIIERIANWYVNSLNDVDRKDLINRSTEISQVMITLNTLQTAVDNNEFDARMMIAIKQMLSNKDKIMEHFERIVDRCENYLNYGDLLDAIFRELNLSVIPGME